LAWSSVRGSLDSCGRSSASPVRSMVILRVNAGQRGSMRVNTAGSTRVNAGQHGRVNAGPQVPQ
jgi:hypothetical protein